MSKHPSKNSAGDEGASYLESAASAQETGVAPGARGLSVDFRELNMPQDLQADVVLCLEFFLGAYDCIYDVAVAGLARSLGPCGWMAYLREKLGGDTAIQEWEEYVTKKGWGDGTKDTLIGLLYLFRGAHRQSDEFIRFLAKQEGVRDDNLRLKYEDEKGDCAWDGRKVRTLAIAFFSKASQLGLRAKLQRLSAKIQKWDALPPTVQAELKSDGSNAAELVDSATADASSAEDGLAISEATLKSTLASVEEKLYPAVFPDDTAALGKLLNQCKLFEYYGILMKQNKEFRRCFLEELGPDFHRAFFSHILDPKSSALQNLSEKQKRAILDLFLRGETANPANVWPEQWTSVSDVVEVAQLNRASGCTGELLKSYRNTRCMKITDIQPSKIIDVPAEPTLEDVLEWLGVDRALRAVPYIVGEEREDAIRGGDTAARANFFAQVGKDLPSAGTRFVLECEQARSGATVKRIIVLPITVTMQEDNQDTLLFEKIDFNPPVVQMDPNGAGTLQKILFPSSECSADGQFLARKIFESTKWENGSWVPRFKRLDDLRSVGEVLDNCILLDEDGRTSEMLKRITVTATEDRGGRPVKKAIFVSHVSFPGTATGGSRRDRASASWSQQSGGSSAEQAWTWEQVVEKIANVGGTEIYAEAVRYDVDCVTRMAQVLRNKPYHIDDPNEAQEPAWEAIRQFALAHGVKGTILDNPELKRGHIMVFFLRELFGMTYGRSYVRDIVRVLERWASRQQW